METTNQIKHRGPHPGMLALIFAVLFITGLSFVITFSAGQPHFPNPADPAQTIVSYFQNHPHDALMCALFQFMSVAPLGLYAMTMASRLRFLGNKAAGPFIALFGGVMTAVNTALTALLIWVMAYPGIAHDASVIRALYYAAFAIGGVGYSVPMGLLIAGIAVSAGFMKLLPKWMVVFGIVLACFGEVSCLSLVFPNLVLFIPLTRFPGFIWLVIAGFMLPGSIARKNLNIT